MLLRNRQLGCDLVIGHTRRVFVAARATGCTAGTMFARASDNGAPDGCHLHFEKRAVGGGLDTATWPRPLLGAARPEASDHVSHANARAGAAQLPRRRRPAAHRSPSKHAKLLVVLDHLAQAFEPGRRYPEPEVNEVLERFHPDYAALRRYLVEDQFLTREDGVYWRSGGTLRCLSRGRDRAGVPRRGLVRRGPGRRPLRRVHRSPTSTSARSRTAGALFDECTFHGCRFNASVHQQLGVRGLRLPADQLLRRDLRRLQAARLGVRRLHAAADQGASGGQWRGVTIRGANLTGLDLERRRPARGRPVAVRPQPAPSLRDAQLDGASLRETDLGGADLRGASLDRRRPRRRPARGAPGSTWPAPCSSRSCTAPTSTWRSPDSPARFGCDRAGLDDQNVDGLSLSSAGQYAVLDARRRTSRAG